MAQRIIELTCPGCGARVSTNMTECEWCHKPVVISTFNSVKDMPIPLLNNYVRSYNKDLNDNPTDPTINTSIGMCYLKLGLYENAIPAFEKAIVEDFDNSELYFYSAVSLLKGKKAFLAPRNDINLILDYMDAALKIEPRGIYYYFLAYIKYDFFERKYLNTSPNYKECLDKSNQLGTSQYDKDMLFELLKVDRPERL